MLLKAKIYSVQNLIVTLNLWVLEKGDAGRNHGGGEA